MSIPKSLTAALAAATLIVGAGAATAQTAAPAKKPVATAPVAATPAAAKPAKPAKVAKAKKPKAARTAESIACSAEANAKGLKGKDRKKFRAACMKKAKAAPKKAA